MIRISHTYRHTHIHKHTHTYTHTHIHTHTQFGHMKKERDGTLHQTTNKDREKTIEDLVVQRKIDRKRNWWYVRIETNHQLHNHCLHDQIYPLLVYLAYYIPIMYYNQCVIYFLVIL